MPSVGHLPLLHHLAEHPVRELAALGHHGDRRMRRQAHLARVEVVAPGQHHPVHPIEDRRQIASLISGGMKTGSALADIRHS